MNTLKQGPVREIGATNRVASDGIYRDEISPFRVRRTDYLACCRFSNEVEKFRVRSSAIAALEGGNRGFRLKMTSDAGSEYEVEVRDGMAKLGAVKPHQPRQLLASGSASSEATWTGFSAIIKEKESSNAV